MTAPLAHGPSPPAEAGVRALDRWLVRVDREDLTLTVTGGGRVTTHGRLTGFAAGSIYAAPGTATNLVAPLAVEQVLASLQHDDDAHLAALRGQFVLAVSDRESRTARVIRDPLGTFPLFRTTTRDAHLFAARATVLLEQPGVSRDLNRAAIADHLCKRWPLRQETFFAAISRVPPGWRVRLTRDVVDARRYWDPVDPTRAIDFLPDDEVERFDGLLDLAVARGVSGRRAGVFLSGGFDSVSVAAVACDLSSRFGQAAPRALSIGFPDPTCSEQDVQRAVAAQLGMPIDLVEFDDAVGSSGLLREGLALNAQADAPLVNPWVPAYAPLVARAAACGIDTIFTGQGGDEWLGTTPYLAADLWRRGDLAGLLHLARTWKRSFRLGWPNVMRGTIWRYGLRPVAGQFAHRLAPNAWDARRARKVVDAIPAWINPDPELRALQYDRAHESLAPANPPGGFYAREARVFLDHPLMSWLFEEQFAFGAPHGIRYVQPYWDADLVAHMCRVPPERLNEGNRNKALVRQTVDRRFPGLGFRRHRKVTAITFFADLVRREAPAQLARVADFRGLASIGVVVPAATAAFFAEAWRSSPSRIGLAWNLVNMEVWVRRQLNLQ